MQTGLVGKQRIVGVEQGDGEFGRMRVVDGGGAGDRAKREVNQSGGVVHDGILEFCEECKRELSDEEALTYYKRFRESQNDSNTVQGLFSDADERRKYLEVFEVTLFNLKVKEKNLVEKRSEGGVVDLGEVEKACRKASEAIRDAKSDCTVGKVEVAGVMVRTYEVLIEGSKKLYSALDWYENRDKTGFNDTAEGRDKFMKVVGVLLADLKGKVEELKAADPNVKLGFINITRKQVTEAIKEAKKNLSEYNVAWVDSSLGAYRDAVQVPYDRLKGYDTFSDDGDGYL